MILQPTYRDDETIEGDPCYVLAGWFGPLKRVYWISKKTLLVRQHQQVFGDGSVAPELTDEYLKGLVEASGRQATPEAIAEFREVFQAVAEDRSDLKGTITETHVEISVDKEIADKELEPDLMD